jgi:hypothetical protein
MGHREFLLCDTTYPNATTARSATRESVRRTSGFVQVWFRKLQCIPFSLTTAAKWGLGYSIGQCRGGLARRPLDCVKLFMFALR